MRADEILDGRIGVDSLQRSVVASAWRRDKLGFSAAISGSTVMRELGGLIPGNVEANPVHAGSRRQPEREAVVPACWSLIASSQLFCVFPSDQRSDRPDDLHRNCLRTLPPRSTVTVAKSPSRTAEGASADST